MHRRHVVLAALAVLVAAHSARSEGIAVTPNLGLSGLGVDVTYRLSSRFNLRAGGTLPSTPELKDAKIGDVKYDLKPKLGGLNAFVDWHPFAGGFHVSGGMMTLRDSWTLEAVPLSTYKLNGVTYAAREVGTLSGEIRFGNTLAPALLVGFGNAVRPGRRMRVVFDAGLAYVGKQDFILDASGPLAGDATFRHDLEAERRNQSAEHSLLPVVKLGLAYRF